VDIAGPPVGLYAAWVIVVVKVYIPFAALIDL
jgi:hypothetical protein